MIATTSHKRPSPRSAGTAAALCAFTPHVDSRANHWSVVGLLERVLAVGSEPSPLSRTQWIQSAPALLVLAAALFFQFAVGLDQWSQGHAVFAAAWWLLAPVLVVRLFFAGLQLMLSGMGPIRLIPPCPLGPTFRRTTPHRRRHRTAVRRARDAIP